MFEAPAHAFRVTASGALQALRPVPPDPESDRSLLLDWCTAQGHTLFQSSSVFPVVRETAATPDLQVDLLLLTETGLLVAVLVNPDSSPSPSPLLGAALAAAQWCETLKYDDLEELFNADADQPRSLLEAFRAHFSRRPDLSLLPSALSRSYLVLLIVPHDAAPALRPLAAFLEARAVPIRCVEYSRFQADDETLLVVSAVGDELSPAEPPADEPTVHTSTIGDVAAVVRDLEGQPEPDSPSAGEPGLESLVRRRPKEGTP